MKKQFIANASIIINAPISKVWDALVNPEIISKYMFSTDVVSDFNEGREIFWNDEWQGKKYEDKRKILKIEKEHFLQYSHLSPLTGNPDAPENYHIVTIDLSDNDKGTLVSLSQDNIGTDEARQQSEKNWNIMLENLKKFLESQK